MKKNAMRKNLTQSILKSLGRYLAIVMIIALGASMFVGLLMTKSDMVATGQKYMDEQNMFDLRLVSPYGWDLEHVEQIAQLEGVLEAEGLLYVDAFAGVGQVGDDSSVFRFYAIPEIMNKIVLRSGRMPTAPNECLADGFHNGEDLIGKQVFLTNTNTDSTLDSFVHETYTIVGLVSSPLYMDMNRGSTSLGSGTLSNYFYILPEGFDVDYYAEINITIPGDFEVYTDAYNDAMENMAEKLEPLVNPLVQKRFEMVKQEAMEAYEEGLAEYEEGLAEFEKGKAEALRELEDGYKKLKDAENLIQSTQAQLADGQKQLEEAKETLRESEETLADGKKTLQETKDALYAPINSALAALEVQRLEALGNLQAVEAELQPIDAQLAELNASISEKENRLNELNRLIAELDLQIASANTNISLTQGALNAAKIFPILNAELITQLEGRLSELQTQRDGLVSQRDPLAAERSELYSQLEEPFAQRTQLQLQRAEVDGRRQIVQASYDTIMNSISVSESAKKLLDEQFASSESEIAAAEQQIKDGWAQVRENEAKIANGWAQIAQGKKDLEAGWIEYEEGKATAEKELADAEKELTDAKLKLDDALDTINSMTEGKVIILDRNSNIGYGSLDSASDIVSGVSRVFPAFFLLVAALVCITTMTRMIDEERTQIGTLKALGYSNWAIISKYLIYAGSGAIVGCGLGVLVGSMVFPSILWEAYKIMLYITPGIVLEINWILCGIVVFAYTSVMLLVTWYCCRKTLQEVPAELIRPKAPDAGKKIFMEHLPFWHKISFLNKVTIRNIFRYRQRLAMMMVGIGGCTALLVTGFGLRDSIVNVVDYQFEEVTTYDIMVYFSEGQNQEQKDRFRQLTKDHTENVMFYEQSSVEIYFDNQTREITMMAAGDDITDFVDFHAGEVPVFMPGVNEVLLTVGVAENMGIGIGDTVTLRNSDMESLELTVSGIYDNHVQNYAIIRPETIQSQWNRPSEDLMALVRVGDDQDVYDASSVITELSSVMNVSISRDLASMVSRMMEALDLVVVVVVVCAGLLAAIVLYNLTNINITERIREIATIKVLGFNSKETAAYVFKENLSLSAIGSVLGLGLGYLLLQFVMSQIKIDFVWFKAMVLPMSYVIAIVLTMLAACIVDFVFYFKLEKINMAEALKSVE